MKLVPFHFNVLLAEELFQLCDRNIHLQRSGRYTGWTCNSLHTHCCGD